jgi:hypothetical protein
MWTEDFRKVNNLSIREDDLEEIQNRYSGLMNKATFVPMN